MSPVQLPEWGRAIGFPRVSGDEPLNDRADQDEEAFSPRERG